MSNIPDELKYTNSHEWVRDEGNGEITVGITDHAQDLLGDIVFVELPELQQALDNGTESAVVESVKAAADVFSPCEGEIVAINTILETTPQLVNVDPYGEGWLFKIRVNNDGLLNKLLDAESYAKEINE